MSAAISAADLGVPESFNAATYFIDRQVREGRGSHVAIECGDERVTYAQLLERVNRCANALRSRLDVRPEERVMLLLLDEPAFAYAFFGALKAGAVAVPVNTLLKAADYRYLLDDMRARVLIISAALLPQVEHIARVSHGRLRQVVVVGESHRTDMLSFEQLLADEAPDCVAETTSRNDAAFWLYSLGSTGAPKGCVHLHHDMVVCAELFGKGVLGIRSTDRTFSVAKLFFAYGLGNALYFPFRWVRQQSYGLDRPRPPRCTR